MILGATFSSRGRISLAIVQLYIIVGPKFTGKDGVDAVNQGVVKYLFRYHFFLLPAVIEVKCLRSIVLLRCYMYFKEVFGPGTHCHPGCVKL